MIDNDLIKKYTGKCVLVTGGAGFIGSNLARQLADWGAFVTIVDSLIPDYGGNLSNLDGYKEKIRLNIADVRDPYSMGYLIQDQDFLFNLAGQVSHTDSMENPYTDLEINVRSQISILEACKKYNPNIRILFASTRQIYGKPKYLPVDENHPIDPVDVNGINKVSAEYYHLLYGKLFNIPVTALRLTNTYGPRMRIKDARQTFIGWWIRQLLEGQTLQIFGDGQQLRDLNYIQDVIDAMLISAVSPNTIGEVLNLGGNPISLLNLAQLMIAVNGKGSYNLIEFPSNRKAIDIGSYFGDYSKLNHLIGWVPKVALNDGIKNTLLYFKDNMQNYL